MHPFVFNECVRCAEQHGFRRIRVAREFGNPLPPRRDYSQFFSKLIRHWVFLALAANSNRQLARSSLERLDGVLGLWETGRMNEDYLLHAIPQMTSGKWEIYLHPGAPESPEELEALLSSQLKKWLEKQKMAAT